MNKNRTRNFFYTFLVFVFISFICFTSCISCIHSNYNNIEVFRKYYRSVGIVSNQPGPLGNLGTIATAFAIDRDYLLTAGHWCEGVVNAQAIGRADKNILITTSDSNGMAKSSVEGIIVAHVLEELPTVNDICIIYSKNHGLLPLKLSNNFSKVKVEDKVVVVGAPKGYFPVRSTGFIAQKQSYRHKIYKDSLLIALRAKPGNSGSPVIWHNEVIGMLVAIPMNNPDLALCITVDKLINFYKKQK